MTATMAGTDIGTCTVHGVYIDLEGNPIAGSISFIPRPVMLIDFTDTSLDPLNPSPATAIVAAPKRAELDPAGHFAITLPATDNTAISPLRWTYQVKENFAGGRSYDIEAPAGTDVDLIRASPVPDSTGTPIVRGPRGLDGAVQSVQGRNVDAAGNVDLTGTVLLAKASLGEIADLDNAQRAVPSSAGTHQSAARINIGAVGWADTGTLTNKTVNDGHLAGGTLSGTFTGAPTLSGAVVLSGAPHFTGHPQFSDGVDFTGNPSFSGTPNFTGDPTFAAAPAFAGAPVFSGHPKFTDGVDFSGNPAFSGAPTFSGAAHFTGNPTFAGNPSFTGDPVLDGAIATIKNKGGLHGNAAAVLVVYGGQFANDGQGDVWHILNGGHSETLTAPIDTQDIVNINNGRIVIGAKLAGHWLVFAQASFAVNPRVALGQVGLFLNGEINLLGNIAVGVEQFVNSNWEPMANNADTWAGIQGNASFLAPRIVELAAGDYLQLAVHACGDGGNYGLAVGTGQRTVLSATPI